MKNSRLDAIKDWEERISRARFRVDLLAKNCGITGRQLERYIHGRFQETPRAWIARKRLELAHVDLLQGAPVKEAAAQAGYAHASHLSRAFKRFYGKSPSASRLDSH